jgi:hypothetical protein
MSNTATASKVSHVFAQLKIMDNNVKFIPTSN